MEELDYMNDYDEAPLIEEDIKAVFDKLKLNEVDYSVDRHYYGDGKHKIMYNGKGFRDELQIKASTLRKDFIFEFKENVLEALERKNIDFNDWNNVEYDEVELEARRILRTWNKETLIDDILSLTSQEGLRDFVEENKE